MSEGQLTANPAVHNEEEVKVLVTEETAPAAPVEEPAATEEAAPVAPVEEAAVSKVFYNGAEVVERLGEFVEAVGDEITGRQELCRMSDGTTQHVPLSILGA